VREPSEIIYQRANNVIGAPIEVHRILRLGYAEKTYEQALALNFNDGESGSPGNTRFH